MMKVFRFGFSSDLLHNGFHAVATPISPENYLFCSGCAGNSFVEPHFIDTDGRDDLLGGDNFLDDDFRLAQFSAGEAEQSGALRATGAPPATLHFFADACSAGAATALSAPLNYARNAAFATPVEQPPCGMATALASLAREVCAKPSARAGLHHLSRRLNVGWGTVRVAGGMALSAFAFEHFAAAAAWARSRAGGT